MDVSVRLDCTSFPPEKKTSWRRNKNPPKSCSQCWTSIREALGILTPSWQEDLVQINVTTTDKFYLPFDVVSIYQKRDTQSSISCNTCRLKSPQVNESILKNANTSKSPHIKSTNAESFMEKCRCNLLEQHNALRQILMVNTTLIRVD